MRKRHAGPDIPGRHGRSVVSCGKIMIHRYRVIAWSGAMGAAASTTAVVNRRRLSDWLRKASLSGRGSLPGSRYGM